MNVVDTKNRLGVNNTKNMSGCFEATADLSADMAHDVTLRVQAYGAETSDNASLSLTQLEIACSTLATPKVRLLVNNVWTQL